MIVGDRYETLSAAQAATLARLPIIHIHGGEETLGAIDNLFRNAIGKMAHLQPCKTQSQINSNGRKPRIYLQRRRTRTR